MFTFHSPFTSRISIGRPCAHLITLKPLAALVAIFAIQAAFPAVVAANDPLVLRPGDSYVYYSPDYVPNPAGTVVDVTGELSVAADDHQYDIYGNELVVNTSSQVIYDLNGQAVGFIAGAN